MKGSLALDNLEELYSNFTLECCYQMMDILWHDATVNLEIIITWGKPQFSDFALFYQLFWSMSVSWLQFWCFFFHGLEFLVYISCFMFGMLSGPILYSVFWLFVCLFLIVFHVVLINLPSCCVRVHVFLLFFFSVCHARFLKLLPFLLVFLWLCVFASTLLDFSPPF